MKPRKLGPLLKQLTSNYPVVTLTGPRQSGKTTLCRGLFPDKPFVSLEPLDQRNYANADPRGFLAEYAAGAVIDEVQHAPGLASYLQEAVDSDPTPGRYILTGSQHFGLTQAIAQSLAGRTAILHLLPFSLDELEAFDTLNKSLYGILTTGGYPRIYDRGLQAQRWLADYMSTYVERDVRQITNIGDLGAFTQFVKLCAARTGREINLSSLGADAGVSHNTAKAWLSVLEASFIIFRAPAWHRNIRKQLVKAPKLHFLDSGLACHLIGVREPEQLRHHPLRGEIFESWVAAEIYKHRAHMGLAPALLHFRESRGLEIDIIVDDGVNLFATEVKSAATIDASFFKSLNRFQEMMETLSHPPNLVKRLVYGGDERQKRTAVDVIDWRTLHQESWSV